MRRTTTSCWPHSTRRALAPNSTLGIGAAWFNFYHGGLRYPRVETTIDVKRVAVKVLEWEPPAGGRSQA